MFKWVLNMPLIMSSIIIWHVYESIANFKASCITNMSKSYSDKKCLFLPLSLLHRARLVMLVSKD